MSLRGILSTYEIGEGCVGLDELPSFFRPQPVNANMAKTMNQW